MVVVTISFAVVERALGTMRVMLIAIGGHVGATLITEGAVAVGILRRTATTDISRPDVGISYAMLPSSPH